MTEQPNTIFKEDISDPAIKNLIRRMLLPGSQAGVIVYKDVKAAFEAIKKELHFIQAAGGLVINSRNEVLMIFRRGKWDLPKGKLDKGESIESCAVREVEEETGITNVQIKESLIITYHTYFQGKNLIRNLLKGRILVLKESHWFLMQCEDDQEFTPQTDEDIEKCEWVKIENLAPYLKNTHGSIRDVIDAGKDKLQMGKVI